MMIRFSLIRHSPSPLGSLTPFFLSVTEKGDIDPGGDGLCPYLAITLPLPLGAPSLPFPVRDSKRGVFPEGDSVLIA